MQNASKSILLVLCLAVGCGTGDVPKAPPAAPVDLDPADPTILKRPFTAEEIRDEWIPGLRILMRRTTPEGTQLERWTVMAADNEGAEIEYAMIADDASVDGEPQVKRSTWVELRDHASFPAARSSRDWVSRSTPLGDFEGWLYRVEDPEAAAVQEYFFVPDLPGAPVQMRILEGEITVFELEQTARLRPEGHSTGAVDISVDK
ncbi:MAG: hypothetical protein P8127_07595 [Acidobacteriota bacterium]